MDENKITDQVLLDLYKERDKHVTGFFWLGLHIAGIFAVPAVAAVLVGKWINNEFDVSKVEFILLFIAFFASWIWVGVLYNKKSKSIKVVEDRILLRKKELEIENV